MSSRITNGSLIRFSGNFHLLAQQGDEFFVRVSESLIVRKKQISKCAMAQYVISPNLSFKTLDKGRRLLE